MIETKRRDPFITLADEHAERAFRYVNSYQVGGTTTFPDQASVFGGGLNLFSDATSDRVTNEIDTMVTPWLDVIAVVVAVVPQNYPVTPPVMTPLEVAPGTLVEVPTVGTQEIAVELRDAVDLAVQDVAAMVGLRRRRYYELLNGDSTSRETESRMSRLLAAFKELGPLLGGDPRLLRSAVLTPVGPDQVSLYEAAVEGNADAISSIVKTLSDRFSSGTIRGLGPRPVPRTRTSAQGSARAREAITDTPVQGRSEGDGGDS